MNRRGGTLAEVLAALFLFVSILPALFLALGMGLLGVLKLRAADDRVYGAEWWFNRLERPVCAAALSAMPRSLPGSLPGEGLFFSWSSKTGDRGEIWVTLEVRSELSDAVLVRTRAF